MREKPQRQKLISQSVLDKSSPNRNQYPHVMVVGINTKSQGEIDKKGKEVKSSLEQNKDIEIVKSVVQVLPIEGQEGSQENQNIPT